MTTIPVHYSELIMKCFDYEGIPTVPGRAKSNEFCTEDLKKKDVMRPIISLREAEEKSTG